MNIIINPGSGAIEETVSWENAYENIKTYIEDSEIPLRIVRSEHKDDEGRYLFVLKNDEYDYETEVEMPGLPLERVRYVGRENQNVFDFPRLYIDGSSWLWCYATVKKEYIKEILERRQEEMSNELEKIRRLSENLKE